MTLVRAHIMVSGMVQGVFFRSHAREMAAACHLTGWVRNTHDGRVEAIFEGEKPSVEAMIEWCERGPPSASVEDMEVEWQRPKGDYTSFMIHSTKHV